MLIYIMLKIGLEINFGYLKNTQKSACMRFRIWHSICAAANIDRSAIASVIGEKSVRLLEEVTSQEPRPWTIAESLEMLKDKPDKP